MRRKARAEARCRFAYTLLLMRPFSGWLSVLVLVICSVLMSSPHTTLAQQRTPVTLTRIYTGSDGQTHAESLEIKLTPAAGRFAQFAQWWDQSQTAKVTSSHFVRWAPGFVQDWHPAAARRYVISLSGQGEVELPGGQKIPLQPGRVLLAEDLTGKGHVTRTLGNADWIVLFVQFEE
jgi:hypothetical protein